MSQDVFEQIASDFPAHRQSISKLARYLASQSINTPIRLDNAADFTGIDSHVLQTFLDELVSKGLIREHDFWVCRKCDAPLESHEDENGRKECDICFRSYDKDQVDHEPCYLMTRPILPWNGAIDTESPLDVSDNPLANSIKQRHLNITPWRMLSESEFTVSITTLDGGTRNAILENLQRYGIVRLRWQGDPPTRERILSLENWIGPARQKQNDYDGKVKSLIPNYNEPPVTGNSSQALAPHVDGTQDDTTPAILAFQYDLSATWGAESTFIDMAAMLGSLSFNDLEEILLSLSRHDCATCTKQKGDWSKTFNGPLVRAEYEGGSISVRLRGDDLLKAIPECITAFNRLKDLVNRWGHEHTLRFAPQEGDLVIFDNWRLLHGREAIGGRHQRIHDRMWIDRLLPEYAGKYITGVRPLTSGLMDAIEKANKRPA